MAQTTPILNTQTPRSPFVCNLHFCFLDMSFYKIAPTGHICVETFCCVCCHTSFRRLCCLCGWWFVRRFEPIYCLLFVWFLRTLDATFVFDKDASWFRCLLWVKCFHAGLLVESFHGNMYFESLSGNCVDCLPLPLTTIHFCHLFFRTVCAYLAQCTRSHFASCVQTYTRFAQAKRELCWLFTAPPDIHKVRTCPMIQWYIPVGKMYHESVISHHVLFLNTCPNTMIHSCRENVSRICNFSSCFVHEHMSNDAMILSCFVFEHMSKDTMIHACRENVSRICNSSSFFVYEHMYNDTFL